jgi:hypothetical protein
LEPIVATVNARVLVSDDADAFKMIADEAGLKQPVCKSHVGRNTLALIENLSQQIQAGADRGAAARSALPSQPTTPTEPWKAKTQCHSMLYWISWFQ